jgi:hypothetical protein
VVVDVIYRVSGSFAIHKLLIPQKGGLRHFPLPAYAGSTLGA